MEPRLVRSVARSVAPEERLAVSHAGTRYSIINESMKELLTKKFWLDVKKTFDEAREESPNSGDSPAASPAGAKSKGSEASEVPLPPEATQPKN